ncbi:hypothetical protein AB0H36_27650 [Kribbella sp. NPDC050820]|uniref:hypothetical protein n=1 Tax=Kribbella sp. NPDC050820 TaxID=3155408 RepID=UPI0033C277BF
MTSDAPTVESRLDDIEEALGILMEPNTMTENPSAWTALHKDPDQRSKYLDYVAGRWAWIVETYVVSRATGSQGAGAHTYQAVAEARCWMHHPAVVEEVCALVAAWTEAYHRNSKPTSDPINWHDRWLPNCIARIADYGIAECVTDQTCHRTGEKYPEPADDTRVPA